MSESSLDSELLAVAGAKKSAKKRARKALSESEEEDVSSEDVSLDDESELEEMATRRVSCAALRVRLGAAGSPWVGFAAAIKTAGAARHATAYLAAAACLARLAHPPPSPPCPAPAARSAPAARPPSRRASGRPEGALQPNPLTTRMLRRQLPTSRKKKTGWRLMRRT